MSASAALVHRLDALGRFVEVVSGHVNGSASGRVDGFGSGRVDGFALAEVDVEALAAARGLVERATARLRLSGEHAVVALAGASGGGKSSLFNALARMQLSPAGHLRPTTGSAHACVWSEDGADALLDWLGVGPSMRFSRESVLDGEDEALLRGLVLLDLPDVDSVATGHRVEADRLVGIVDLVIWVLDPQKYADQTVHDEYLRHMGALRDVTVVVFNQVDRLTPADALRCRADLARLVVADGLPEVPVIATSALHGVGVGDVRTLLETTVAGRQAAMARLEGELDAALDALLPLVGPEVVHEERVRDAVHELADGFAAAGGVGALAVEAGHAYARRAALPGWPLRLSHRGAGDPEVPPAEPSAIGLSVRRFAARTTGGLPPPWPEQVRLAASADVDRLPDELGRALNAARPRPPRAIGWLLARALWWLAVAMALAGVGWISWYGVERARANSGTGLPDVGGVAVPLLMMGGGGLVAVALVLLGRPLGAARARRLAAGVDRRLREATATVAREVVAPVRDVLRDHADAQLAIRDAAQLHDPQDRRPPPV